MPLVVTGAFATNFVAAVSVANVAGRLGWSNLSDYLGPQRVVNVLGVAAPICATVPTVCVMAATDPGYVPLGLFCGSTLAVVANFGGWFSVLPSYIATVFGPQHAGAIMGRLLTGYSAAAIAGVERAPHAGAAARASAKVARVAETVCCLRTSR